MIICYKLANADDHNLLVGLPVFFLLIIRLCTCYIRNY